MTDTMIAVITSRAVTAIGELDLSPILKLVGFHIQL